MYFDVATLVIVLHELLPVEHEVAIHLASSARAKRFAGDVLFERNKGNGL
jgi:hypothetical protein